MPDIEIVLDAPISETQSVFVTGKQITYNNMITQKMFHALRANQCGRNKGMAIKSDIRKTYDHMEQKLIRYVMKHMGFSETWIEWIMLFVTTVKYRVLMNVQPKGNIVPQRGICQGDSLSLFIFILFT